MQALSITQIEEGCTKVLENARELIDDAELLLEKERFARAYFLAHLACEEMAKVPMLVGAAVDVLSGRELDWVKLHRRLRCHNEKIMGILVIDYFNDMGRGEDPDAKELKEYLGRLRDYKKVKEYSLYAGLIDGVFRKPSELIVPELATALVKVARDRLSFFESIALPRDGRLEETLKSPYFKDLSRRFIDPLREKMNSGTG